MSSKTEMIPTMVRAASLNAGKIDKEARTAEIVWSTGAKVLRRSFWSGDYYEELSMDQKSIRMDRLNGGAPLLNSHQQNEISDILGVVEKAWIENGEGRAVVRFSTREDVEPIWQDVMAGIIRNISVGYQVYRYEETGAPEGEPPTFTAVDWEPCELSAVAVGADPDAGFRSMGKTNRCEIVKRTIDSNNGGKRMSVDVDNLLQGGIIPDNKKIQEEAIKTERQRQSEIRSLCRAHKLSEEFADNLIDGDTTIDAARATVLSELEKRSSQASINGTVSITRDAADTRKEGMTEALLHRSAPDKYTLTEKGKAYRGMSLLRMAEEMVGSSARLLSKSELAVRGLATSDFAETLSNVAGKRLRDSYGIQPQTFKPLVTLATLPDYKPVSRVQFGDASDLQSVNENGEYELGSIGEGAEKYQLSKYGRRIRINEEVIVNDDLDAFSRVPALFGAAAARLESKLFWNIFLNNPNMADSVALFHANHGNLGVASAINDTALSAAKSAMRKQKTLDGADFLDLQPAFLICGPDKEVEARKMLSAILLATKTADINVWSNSMQLIVESRVTGNQWFTSAGKDQIDLIEMGTLDGMAGPQMSTRQIFESDAVEIKCKHVVAFKAIDYRGLYKNPGA